MLNTKKEPKELVFKNRKLQVGAIISTLMLMNVGSGWGQQVVRLGSEERSCEPVAKVREQCDFVRSDKKSAIAKNYIQVRSDFIYK
ncbi:hypothetical protein [Nostoc sp. WHI]|uniref:hypothetical protein n=1 Tax=Nostoc sp. WHI TaxID=2650611 RepID=UPI0018C70FBB|nr:hypothetical protein [Nostoc sp. WHI]MBG1271529.1 hypothetical protein [Nostoc sp. WHI]